MKVSLNQFILAKRVVIHKHIVCSLLLLASIQFLNAQTYKFTYGMGGDLTDYKMTEVYVYPETWEVIIHNMEASIDYEWRNYINDEVTYVNSSSKSLFKYVGITQPKAMINYDTVSVVCDSFSICTVVEVGKTTEAKAKEDATSYERVSVIDLGHAINDELPYFPSLIPTVQEEINSRRGLLLNQIVKKEGKVISLVSTKSLLSMDEGAFSIKEDWSEFEEVPTREALGNK